MKKIIIANWKMNPRTASEVKMLARAVTEGVKKIKNMEITLCPPFLFVSAVKKIIANKKNIKLGAQNVFSEKAGAFTGEISATQLKSIGVGLVIVGHSERRALGESKEIINKKLRCALEGGLNAVLCIGEKEKSKEGLSGIIREELYSAIKGIKKSLLLNKLIIVYEPIWAISTNPGSEPDDPQNVYETTILLKRDLLKILGRRAASQIPILYGGSVNEKNVVGFKKSGIDGFLVGSASLNAGKFIKIVKFAAL
ncbi:triose-phosphate isomerase [Candidatus Giovannonibacteria bacterium]|nr:triose-phosphate isomerase [Candidatus Giovannonibacteria bacterium]